MKLLGILGALVFVLSATSDTNAKLISATLPAPDEDAYFAVHRPTGCQAKVVLSGERLVKASITDPLCLPPGVRERDVPGTAIDFLVTPN